MSFTFGFLADTGKVPGFARVETVSMTILFMEMGISYIRACKNDHWKNCDSEHSFAGISIGIGVTFPGGFNAARSTAYAYASNIEIQKDAPVHLSQCPAQKWELFIESWNSRGSTDDPISVHFFGSKEELDRAKSYKTLGTQVAIGCGHEYRCREEDYDAGARGCRIYKMELDYRPYAVQVVNWGSDDLFVDYMTLTRVDSLSGGKREKYKWGGYGGKGWVISTNKNALNDWKDRHGSQTEAFNSFAFPVDIGGGYGWDVSCDKSHGYCNQLKLTYVLKMDATHSDMDYEDSNDGVDVYVDGQLKRECLEYDSCLLLLVPHITMHHGLMYCFYTDTFSKPSETFPISKLFKLTTLAFSNFIVGYYKNGWNIARFQHYPTFGYIDFYARGGDAAYLDQVTLEREDSAGKKCNFAKLQAGADNGKGWCLSKDSSDFSSKFCGMCPQYGPSYRGFRWRGAVTMECFYPESEVDSFEMM